MRLNDQRGQMTLEMVLITIVFISASLMVSNFFKTNKVMQAFTQGPWSYLQGMTQSGVWAPAPRAKALHPNRFDRVGTVEGEKR